MNIKRATRDYDMTSFHGHTITTTPERLINLFGPPTTDSNDGEDKVNMEWILELPDEYIFTIYDWKEYKKLQMTHKIQWHIGARNTGISLEAWSELMAIL